MGKEGTETRERYRTLISTHEKGATMEVIAAQSLERTRTAPAAVASEQATFWRRLFCRHDYYLEITGMFDEERVLCSKCGRSRWPDESADF